jgi:hypothetical protein
LTGATGATMIRESRGVGAVFRSILICSVYRFAPPPAEIEADETLRRA